MTPLEIRAIRHNDCVISRKAFAEALSEIAVNLLPNEPKAEITERMIEGWEQGRRKPGPWGIYILNKYSEEQK
jgi:DNA-binding transcriptional regulator YiaG